MNERPSDTKPDQQETKPSLLATVALVAALIPLLMVLQRILVSTDTVSSVWLVNILSFRPPFWRVAIVCCFVTSIMCGLKALSDLKIDSSLRGRWKALVGIFPASFFTGACIPNLKRLSTALTMYDCASNGQMPATLEELVNGTYLSMDITAIKCPRSGKPYIYPGLGRVWQENSSDISVYCPCDHHGK
jgi:hypothetical protein